MNDPRVIGLDLSACCTGVGRVFPTGKAWAVTVEPWILGHVRIQLIREAVTREVGAADLVVIEDASYGSPDPGHQLAGLRWIIRHDLARRDIPYALISPSTLKLFATGNGHIDKPGMIAAAVNAWPDCIMPTDRKGRIKDDAADALWLSAAGLWHLGLPAAAHTPEALNVVKWPETVGAA